MTFDTYTDYYSFYENSSVLDRGWYNADSEQLLLSLKTGNKLLGYSGVSKQYWDALVLNDQTDTGSAGSYWNNFIKGHFAGFDTSEVGTVHSAEDETFEEDEPEDAVLNDYSLNFSYALSDDHAYTDGHTFALRAVDYQAALDAFYVVAELCRWSGAKVNSLTRHF